MVTNLRRGKQIRKEPPVSWETGLDVRCAKCGKFREIWCGEIHYGEMEGVTKRLLCEVPPKGWHIMATPKGLLIFCSTRCVKDYES